ncbi:UDP-2-acetamido-2-deoxy-3-oxo-D-glucuronate aminotransferase [Thalassoglobus neptunius]|uniref:UDP-2-acetamido-2-deoxy-3-oxo-D-glucuronate aminotransferase n=1 Tax=Thalassoglobus neptunius TaxID=1938619 RepID=A0A5C5VYZ1_9PLAN|nr:DegT/DnrJ/EryC1/StrS family aminotransferase [Thalassoglobus neptunius]TWT42979.1 UDP-2-acetamido-2-deoxy-3-oxo-D-glucuronate aminotransferase [Thalassoglobus neptunius]
MSRILQIPSSQDSATPVPLIDLVAQYGTIRDEVQTAVQRVFENQSFVLGQEVSTFEEEMAAYCDARHAIGCASGSDALLLALSALDIGPGDEVITSPYSFFATAGSIARTGATPVFVDIDPQTYNLDPFQIEMAISRRTKAIMPVHLFGQCAEMEPIWRIAIGHGLSVVEDAAQAIGSSYHGRRAGVLGSIGCFSFFPTKNLGGAGDGGLMTTDDKDLATKLKRIRVHGDLGGYQHVEVGINSRLDALQAAVLSVKLKHLDSWSDARRGNAARYRELFAEMELDQQIEAPAEPTNGHHVYNQFTIRVASEIRDEVIKRMRERQVGCAIYYPKPLHLQECFKSLGYLPGDFPEAERAAAETIALPIFAELGADRQRIVVETLRAVLTEIQTDSRSTIRRAA